MKKIVFAAALLGTTAMVTPGAMANFWGHGNGYGNGHNNLCTTDRCSPDMADFLQDLNGLQKAINMIVDVNDATDIVQEAINAGNLVNVGDVEIDLANVEQNADLWQIAMNVVDGDSYWTTDLTNITQSATNVANSISSEGLVTAAKQSAEGSQFATNSALGTATSALYGLEQAATNVVNTVTAATSKTVKQVSYTDQLAVNVIIGGSGGYDADAVDWDADDVIETQVAVNAANLVDLGALTGAITQKSYGSQDALNKAIFNGYHGGNVYDLGQSATNVANSVTVGDITPAVFDCLCYDGWEINQYASVDQVASNLLVTMGNVTNTVQSATNIANSINVQLPE